ncbi:putative zinc carboxypeptidase a [Rosellinia necatrix]|uniref:Putative zinc carboxypeptidase a n=1 Tax=Rosellinia necatrix TaxID=77044 RepID=A0A1W2TKQ2_ROSNE|nr:putative zinc carboxypeptidase a [Rosellinia necatrix]
MRFLRAALLLAPFAAGIQVDRRGRQTYDGYKVFRVVTNGDATEFEAQLESLSAIELSRNRGHIDAQHFDIAVPPESLDAFGALNYEAETLTEDLGADIALEGELQPFPGLETSVPNGNAKAAAALPSFSWFSAYHPYADHLTFLQSLQASFPSNSELITAGTSFEGRAIQGIHLWGSGGKGSKPAIYYHGNVHAREWITSMTVEYITYQLINNYNNDTAVKAVLDNYDFYILPIVNPDGFVYTQTSTRLWRKNRQTRSGTTAVGTDVNRNWPYKWDGAGSSTSPGSAFGDRLGSGKGIKLYIDWHSYGQYILTPYGYSCSAQAPNQSKQNTLARNVGTAIAAVHGTRFTTGQTCSTLYATAGGSNDYFTDVTPAELAWAIELRDTGTYGFTLPANQIIATGEESWAGQKYLWANF